MATSSQQTKPETEELPSPTADSTYETRCGQCGDVMNFKRPLTGWTRVFCGRCNESVYVR